jgi:hypothetical protein
MVAIFRIYQQITRYAENDDIENIWYTYGKITQKLIDFDPFILYSEGFRDESGLDLNALYVEPQDDDDIFLQPEESMDSEVTQSKAGAVLFKPRRPIVGNHVESESEARNENVDKNSDPSLHTTGAVETEAHLD